MSASAVFLAFCCSWSEILKNGRNQLFAGHSLAASYRSVLMRSRCYSDVSGPMRWGAAGSLPTLPTSRMCFRIDQSNRNLACRHPNGGKGEVIAASSFRDNGRRHDWPPAGPGAPSTRGSDARKFSRSTSRMSVRAPHLRAGRRPARISR